jgi:hypothetical protein
MLVGALPAQADDPTFFVQASLDPFMAGERGGTAPARGAAVTLRPVAGLTARMDDYRFTALGGASVSRYAVTPASDTDAVFAMGRLSRTIEGYAFAVSVLAARSYDATFETGVASTLDAALSISRSFAPEALRGWSLTPQVKVTLRQSDLASAERWDFGAALELARPAFGGVFTIAAGYDRLDYLHGGRHDDKLAVTASWLVDVTTNLQIGLRSEASFTRSNAAGKSIDAVEVGPTMRVLFAR